MHPCTKYFDRPCWNITAWHFPRWRYVRKLTLKRKLTLDFIINRGIWVKDGKSTCKFFKIKYSIVFCIKQVKNLWVALHKSWVVKTSNQPANECSNLYQNSSYLIEIIVCYSSGDQNQSPYKQPEKSLIRIETWIVFLFNSYIWLNHRHAAMYSKMLTTDLKT